MGNQHSKWKNLAVPVISVLGWFITRGYHYVSIGYNPVEGYGAMLKGAFGRTYNIGEVLRLATPLILTGLGFSVANTAGFLILVLASRGSMRLDRCYLDSDDISGLTTYCVSAISDYCRSFSGSYLGGIAGYLRAQFGTSEVIVTIMLNYTILYISNHLVRNVFTDSADATPKIGENASLRMQFLSDMSGGSRLNGGIFLAVLMIILVGF